MPAYFVASVFSLAARVLFGVMSVLQSHFEAENPGIWMSTVLETSRGAHRSICGRQKPVDFHVYRVCQIERGSTRLMRQGVNSILD